MVPMSRSRCPCQSISTPTPALLDDPARKPDDGPRAVRRGVTNGIGDADARGAGVDGGAEQPSQRLRIGPRCVFRDVHHAQTLPHRKPDRLLGAAQQILHRPVLGIAPDRTRADEAAAFDRHTRTLDDVGDRLDVGGHRPRGAVGADAQAARGDLRGKPFDVAHHVRAGARQTDVRGVDAERIEQVQDLELLLDRRRPDDGDCRPSRSVSSLSMTTRRPLLRIVAVPVVNQRLIHDSHYMDQITAFATPQACILLTASADETLETCAESLQKEPPHEYSRHHDAQSTDGVTRRQHRKRCAHHARRRHRRRPCRAGRPSRRHAHRSRHRRSARSPRAAAATRSARSLPGG